MTAVVYDPNFAVQLLAHEHKPDMRSLTEGDEIVCATCGRPLVVVCPDGHEDALDRVRYARLLAPSSRAKAYAPPGAKDRAKYQDIPGRCRIIGCAKPRVPRKQAGRGRPPTKCEDHWTPVSKRGRRDAAE